MSTLLPVTRKTVITAVLIFLISSLITACSDDKKDKVTYAPEASDATCEQIMHQVCVKCHYESRVCQNLDIKSKNEWHRTIMNMKKKGAELTESQEKTLLECLTNKEQDILDICKK